MFNIYTDIVNTYAFEGYDDYDVDDILDEVEDVINSDINNEDIADNLVGLVADEAANFNGILMNMADAYRAYDSGAISYESMMTICTEGSSALKDKVIALNLTDDYSDDITEEEIGMVREFLIGCKEIAEARRDDLAYESEYYDDDEYYDDYDDYEESEGLLSQIYATEKVRPNKMEKAEHKARKVMINAGASVAQGQRRTDFKTDKDQLDNDLATGQITEREYVIQKAALNYDNGENRRGIRSGKQTAISGSKAIRDQRANTVNAETEKRIATANHTKKVNTITNNANKKIRKSQRKARKHGADV
jgi:hypothetical protein